MTMRERAIKLYRPPFRFEHGYVYDSNDQMVADAGKDGEPDQLLRVRGWGRISYMREPEALQDEVGKAIAEALTEFWRNALQSREPSPKLMGLENKFAEIIYHEANSTHLDDGGNSFADHAAKRCSDVVATIAAELVAEIERLKEDLKSKTIALVEHDSQRRE